MEGAQIKTAENITPGAHDGNSERKKMASNVGKSSPHGVKDVQTFEEPFLGQFREHTFTTAYDSGNEQFNEKGRNPQGYYENSVNRLAEGQAFVRIANARVHLGKVPDSRYEKKEPCKYSERSKWIHKGRNNFYAQRQRAQGIFRKGKFKFKEYSNKSDRARYIQSKEKMLDRNFAHVGNCMPSLVASYEVSPGYSLRNRKGKGESDRFKFLKKFEDRFG